MGQDEDVDPAVPRRQPPIELDEEPVRIGSAVDEHPAASTALDEDRVALADVEDRDPRRPVRAMGGREPDRDERDDQRAGRDPRAPVGAATGRCLRRG